MVYTKTVANSFRTKSVSSLISLCELHKEQYDIGFITAEHRWRAGWVKVLTRENERVISHWLSAHHRRSRMLRGHWPLSCDCLEEEPHGRAKYEGLNTNTHVPQHSRKEKTLMQVYVHSHIYTLHIQYTFVYRQLDGDDDGADAGRTLTAFRWLMSSVSFSALFLFFPSLHLNPYGALPPTLCVSPSYINVMSPTVRVSESRAASTVLLFFSFIACVYHTFRLWCTSAAVYSAFTFISSVELTAQGVAWRLQCPLSRSYSKLYIDISLTPILLTLTLVLVTVFYAWIDLMVS